MKPEDVHRRLEEAGRSAAPPPDAAFAEALEHRLRAVHGTLRAGQAPAADRPAAPLRAWWRSPVPVAAAMALAVAVSLGVLLRPPAGVELATAFDANVTLPDGRSVQAHAGQRLSEGSVIVTGPRGHVLVDGVRLGPDEIAVVRDDRLHPVKEAPRETGGPVSPAPSPQPRPRPQPTPGPGAASALPGLPTLAPSPSGRPTDKPSDNPSAAPSAAPSEEPRDQPTTRADEAVASGHAEPDARHAIGLAAKGHDGRAMLAWTEFRHPDFAFFVILRAPHPSAPEWPPTGDSELIGRSADPARRQFADDRIPYRPAYRVVAVDRNGRELARSAAVTPARAEAPDRG